MLHLGAATHFSQGWGQSLIGEAVDLGLSTIRDTMNWGLVESVAGTYNFTSSRVSYVDAALDKGLDVSLVFQPANVLYDGGKTLTSAAGIDAFADFIVASLRHYDGVKTIEIGNEFNGDNFVTGKVLSDGYTLRPQHYADIVKGVAAAVHAVMPDVTIVGGAMHSVPVGYAMALAKAGAFEHMDAVAIHPYTSSPEDLGQQLELLDKATGNLPIHVTEFGAEFASLDDAPSYLVKMVSVMAAAGVDEAQWYALYEQSWFPNMQLVAKGGVATPAGESAAFVIDTLLCADSAVRLDSVSGTYAYEFGDRAVVLWGEGNVSFTGATTFFDARGRVISNFDGRLDADDPVIAVGAAPIVAGRTLAITGDLVAHSTYDFDVIADKGVAASFEGPWSYFEEHSGKASQLYTMPGGERSSEAWTPYIGSQSLRPLMVTSAKVNPAVFGSTKYGVLERMTADADETVTVRAHWDVRDTTQDGVTVAIRLNGETIYSGLVFDKANGHVLDVELNDIALAAGDRLDFVTGPNGNASNDMTERTYEVLREKPVVIERTPIAVGEGGGTVVGTERADLVDASGCARAVRVDGRAGSDLIEGGAAADTLSGGLGADILSAGAGNDSLTVDAADTVDGGAGYDKLAVTGAAGVTLDLVAAAIERATGGAGADHFSGAGAPGGFWLDGGAGADVLVGGAGVDSLVGGTGADTLSGGAGNDALTIDAADSVNGGAGSDKVIVSGTEGVTLDLAAAEVERATGGAGGDRFLGAAASGGLWLEGGAGADALFGGSGADNLAGGTGADTLSGGAGNDALTIDAADRVNGGAGSDKVTVSGTEGVTLDLAAAEVERVTGGAGADRLDGAVCVTNLAIEGGAGADTLVGGAGNDSLTGGTGADMFVIGAGGDDRIADFAAGDVLAFDAGVADSLADVLAAARIVGSDLVIDFGDDSVTLRGHGLSILTADAMLFV